MAKISIEFDTLEKTLEVKMDGEVVNDVTSVSIYQPFSYDGDNDDDDEPTFQINLSLGEHDKINKVRKFTHLVASEQNPTGEVSKVKGFRLAPTKVEQEIASFLDRR